MIRCSGVILTIWLLSGCAPILDPTGTPEQEQVLQNWLLFAGRVSDLDSTQLEYEQAIALEQHTTQPDDGTRLRLAYLLSRQHPAVAELDRSKLLLAKINSASALAPLRDLVMNELALVRKLNAKARQVGELHIQVKQLDMQVNDLQMQLAALKQIETDLTAEQNGLEELPQ